MCMRYSFIAKPRLGIVEGMQAYAEEIRAKLKTVARARLRRRAAAQAGAGDGLELGADFLGIGPVSYSHPTLPTNRVV
ncbi:hypothetical protein CAZ09_33420 [Pseudomonas aeruginosa]|nr:hypothetical protein CAZ09_33420 [Pseudomonas aeruginosa]